MFFSRYTIKGLTSETDSYCAAYCLYKICLTKVLGTSFKSAILNVYYQTISWIKMTMRKKTIGNGVKYIRQSEQTQSISRKRDSKRNTIKSHSLPRKPTKTFRKCLKKSNYFSRMFQSYLKMNNELILLIKKHTDTLFEQTKTKPQKTL